MDEIGEKIIYMKTSNHKAFFEFINEKKEVVEAHKISVEGCYLLKVMVYTQEQLNGFLNAMLEYGNYKLSLSIQTMKDSPSIV